ncbi:hypothetical protein BYT27DRAFT_7191388 [Phlegmacium glaucopus]|nr:hypothetical protein BYT27DRAFT_7191388 [Phlegmacium glaucopus]
MASSLPFLYVSSLFTLSAAYSWNFDSPPQQCSNLTVSLTGSGGKPPYRIMVLPYGPTTLKNNLEVRRILDVPFPDGSTTVSFQLKYPANSQLVAVVSDGTAFGSGGTSVAALVQTSSDTSCFDSSTQTSPDFVFSILPPNQIVQCQETRIWWDNSTVQGTTNFLGVIPGGQSFVVPETNITNVSQQGTGFTWKPSIRGGTTLILIGGDNRGNGSAGSTTNLVSPGTSNDITCLSDTSPSSTAGSPVGGTYPTGNGGWTGRSSSGSHVGAIVGSVFGGLAFIIACILLFWVLRRRRNKQKRTKKLPADLIDAEDDDDTPRAMRQNELPQNYQPEPFMIPIPDVTASEFDDDLSIRGPLSAGTGSFYARAETPDRVSTYGGLGGGLGGGGGSSAGGRKGGAPKPMRAVNIIQHQDAGPTNNEEKEEPLETIELPPAYTMMKTSTTSGGDGPSASTSASN